MNLAEIKEKQSKLIQRCQEIIEICKKECRNMTEEEEKEYNDNKEEAEKLKEEAKSCEEEEKKSCDEKEDCKEEPRNDEEPMEPEKEPEKQDDKQEKEPENKEEKENRSINTMEKKFSILKAIRDVAENRGLDAVALGVKGEAVDQFNKAGLSYGGQIQLPIDELRSAITVTSEGDDIVATDIYNILEPLRAKNVLVQAGAKFLTGLVGDVQVPVMTGANVTWEAENADAQDGAGAFTNIKMSPKRLTAYIDISKQFIAQDGIGAENLIRQDLVNAINSKLEATILGNENGSATQPAGIFAGKNLPAITDFKGITTLEAGVEEANIFGEMKYIVAPSAKGALRAMPKGTKLINPVMENGTIDGTPVLSTSNVKKDYMVYGDFSNLAIGSWGAVDLTVDPYTQAGKGMIRLVINAYFDAVVLRKEAFAFATTGEAVNASATTSKAVNVG